MLLDGTRPTAVPANIQSPCDLFTGVEATELPCVNFVHQCRVVLHNINETLSAFRLGNADSWHQVFEPPGLSTGLYFLILIWMVRIRSRAAHACDSSDSLSLVALRLVFKLFNKSRSRDR